MKKTKDGQLVSSYESRVRAKFSCLLERWHVEGKTKRHGVKRDASVVKMVNHFDSI